MLRNLVLLVFMGVFFAGCYGYFITRDLPSIEKVINEGVNPTSFTQIFSRDGTPILSHGKFHHQDVDLSEVSPHFIEALLATEDRRFYQHPGVDPIAIARAAVQNVRARRFREGGSTLTQQLARNVFLSNERSFKRKIREAALSFQLERELTKDQILSLYVNNIYFGEGAYGISAASEIYFNKRPIQLSVDEAAILAGLPQAPSSYSPFHNLDASLARRNEVLGNLHEVGKLSGDELTQLKEKRPSLNPKGRELASANKAPFFNQFVMQEIRRTFDLDEQTFWQSGLKVYTTLDLRAQRLAEQTVRNQSAAYGRNGSKQQASLVSIDPHTGAIIAYVGGRDYQGSQFDRVSQAIRSPGSLFKVFTYTAAIERGYDPTRVYLDEPIKVGDWMPHNYDKAHHGYMTIARALATSNNIIAVKVTNEIGADAVAHTARRMGIKSTLNPYLSLALGGSGVNLLETTSAIGVLANQGVRTEPFAVDHIVDDRGKTIYKHSPVQYDVISRQAVDTMVRMLVGVVQRGTGRAADIGRPVAGKTGTSDDWRDAWFVGFTPEVVTGVWVGNDDNSPMPGMTGGGLPAVIWRGFMSQYMANKPARQFDLAYSKSISDADFVGYNLDNLSEQDMNNPLATLESKEGELETDELLDEDAGDFDPLRGPQLFDPNASDVQGEPGMPQRVPVGPPSPENPRPQSGAESRSRQQGGYQVIPIRPEREDPERQGTVPVPPPSPTSPSVR